jgi:hypothetical protein
MLWATTGRSKGDEWWGFMGLVLFFLELNRKKLFTVNQLLLSFLEEEGSGFVAVLVATKESRGMPTNVCRDSCLGVSLV